MNCKQCRESINLYIDGYLPVDREQEFFAHLDSCGECKRYYEELYLMFDHMEEPEREVPYGFSTRWRAHVAELKPGKKGINFKVFIPALTACICGLFVMTAVVSGQSVKWFGAEARVPAAQTQQQEEQEPVIFSTDGDAQETEAQDQQVITGEAAGGEGYLLEESSNLDPEGADVITHEGMVEEQQGEALQGDHAEDIADIAGGVQSSAASVFSDETPYKVPAEGRMTQQELMEFVMHIPELTTEEMGSSVFVQGSAEYINKVLEHFGLVPVPVEVAAAEIIFE